jgi:hypothetical protein
MLYPSLLFSSIIPMTTKHALTCSILFSTQYLEPEGVSLEPVGGLRAALIPLWRNSMKVSVSIRGECLTVLYKMCESAGCLEIVRV